MPPKGTKKGAARKRGADLKKPAAPKKQKMAQMGIKKNPAPTHDVNGFLTGSKEANWAFLRASGAWYTDLEEVDLVEAEDKGVKLGSNDWVTMKTSQLAPPVLEGTRILSRVEWEFPVPRLGVSELRSSALGRGSKRRADDDDDDDDDDDGAPLSKRARRGAGAGATVTVETRDDGDGKAHVDLLTPLALPTSQQGRSMAFGMGLPVLDTLPPSQRNQATTTITTTTTPPPPPPAHHPSPIPRNDHIITTPPSSSTLSSLASQTPSPPPSTTPPLTPSPALPPATKTTTPGRKGAPRGSFPCPHCDKSFGRVEHLKRHIVSVHEKRRAFVCEGCGARFSRKDNMRQHQGKCGGMMGGVEG